MLFDILLFRYLKNFVRGIYWIPLLHIVLLFVFKFTCNVCVFSFICVALTHDKTKKETAGKDKKPDIIPYTIKVYEILAMAGKTKEA